MTEQIKAAIETLENYSPDGRGNWPTMRESCLTVIAALNDQDKGCDKCSIKRTLPNVASPAESQMSFPLNSRYCRFCGCRLEEK